MAVAALEESLRIDAAVLGRNAAVAAPAGRNLLVVAEVLVGEAAQYFRRGNVEDARRRLDARQGQAFDIERQRGRCAEGAAPFLGDACLQVQGRAPRQSDHPRDAGDGTRLDPGSAPADMEVPQAHGQRGRRRRDDERGRRVAWRHHRHVARRIARCHFDDPHAEAAQQPARLIEGGTGAHEADRDVVAEVEVTHVCLPTVIGWLRASSSHGAEGTPRPCRARSPVHAGLYRRLRYPPARRLPGPA